MHQLGKISFLAALAMAVSTGLCRGAVAAEPDYKLLKEISIGGGSGWDYLWADPVGRRLYVTHGTKVVVIDTDHNKIVGEILDTPGVHGFIAAPQLNRGFSSNGQENKSSIVDLKNLKTIQKVSTGANPDSILFDPKSNQVWTFNGRGQSATVYDAATGKVVVEAIPLDGKPETGVADPQANRVYVNIENKDEVVVIDMTNTKLLPAGQSRRAPRPAVWQSIRFCTGSSSVAEIQRWL
jgi:DNA-binding beta-propeller fold protein YncE